MASFAGSTRVGDQSKHKAVGRRGPSRVGAARRAPPPQPKAAGKEGALMAQPSHLLVHIMAFLGGRALCNIESVSKQFQRIAMTADVWRRFGGKQSFFQTLTAKERRRHAKRVRALDKVAQLRLDAVVTGLQLRFELVVSLGKGRKRSVLTRPGRFSVTGDALCVWVRPDALQVSDAEWCLRCWSKTLMQEIVVFDTGIKRATDGYRVVSQADARIVVRHFSPGMVAGVWEETEQKSRTSALSDSHDSVAFVSFHLSVRRLLADLDSSLQLVLFPSKLPAIHIGWQSQLPFTCRLALRRHREPWIDEFFGCRTLDVAVLATSADVDSKLSHRKKQLKQCGLCAPLIVLTACTPESRLCVRTDGIPSLPFIAGVVKGSCALTCMLDFMVYRAEAPQLVHELHVPCVFERQDINTTSSGFGFEDEGINLTAQASPCQEGTTAAARTLAHWLYVDVNIQEERTLVTRVEWCLTVEAGRQLLSVSL